MLKRNLFGSITLEHYSLISLDHSIAGVVAARVPRLSLAVILVTQIPVKINSINWICLYGGVRPLTRLAALNFVFEFILHHCIDVFVDVDQLH